MYSQYQEATTLCKTGNGIEWNRQAGINSFSFHEFGMAVSRDRIYSLRRSRFFPLKVHVLSHAMGASFSQWSKIVSPGHVAQSVGHLTRKSGARGSIPGLATYFHFSFCFFKKGSCQLLAKVCARSTG